jgi:two-component system chemotaxis response regulator CheB
MSSHDIIVIGGSTGSIPALKQICRDLSSGFPAAVFIVVHIGSEGPNALAGILGANAALPVCMAEEGQPIECGRIYVAAADHHLLVEKDVVRLGRGPRENMTRPAIDPLFRSAAVAFGSRAIGVVLTGHLNDGSAGLAAVKRRGGLAVVQNPSDAVAADMPISALQSCDVDYKAPVAEIGHSYSA